MGKEITLEELQSNYLKLSEDLENYKKLNDTLKVDKEKAEQRQKELEEHNQKLFLKVTSKIEDKPKENEEEKEIKEFIGEDLYKSLNKKELQLLNEIMKGEDEIWQ